MNIPNEKDETRAAIISAAALVFRKYGFRKTTMDEIALAAHKAKSSLYYYFSSKEEVFQAVVEKEALALRGDLSNAVNSLSDPSEKLKAYINIRLQSLENLPNFYDATHNEQLAHFDFIGRIRQKQDKEEVVMMQNILIDGVARKIFHVEDTELAAIAIVIAVKGLEIPLLTTKRIENINLHLDHLLDILLYGLVKR
jgi:AcrR family transcriptional regulator